MGCGYGFVALVKANGFITSNLLDHFRHHYFQMGLIIHFHRAALLRFSRRFSEVTLGAANMDEASYRSLRSVRLEFADFISNQ